MLFSRLVYSRLKTVLSVCFVFLFNDLSTLGRSPPLTSGPGILSSNSEKLSLTEAAVSVWENNPAVVNNCLPPAPGPRLLKSSHVRPREIPHIDLEEHRSLAGDFFFPYAPEKLENPLVRSV